MAKLMQKFCWAILAVLAVALTVAVVQVHRLREELSRTPSRTCADFGGKQSNPDFHEVDVGIINRLHEVNIPDLPFSPTNTMRDAVALFSRMLKEDGEKRGKDGGPAWVLDEPPNYTPPAIPNFSASGISVYDALRVVCKITGYRFKVEGGAVVVWPKGVIVEDISTRTYTLLAKDPNRNWNEFLAARGVKMPEDTHITYEERPRVGRIGKLEVSTTDAGHVQFEKVLDGLLQTSDVELLDDPDNQDGVFPRIITQFSTVDALLASAYDGCATVLELRKRGNLGIGTPDKIDGELIMLDGVAYSARGDGSVKVLNDEDTVAFASVVNASEGLDFSFKGGSYAEFCREADCVVSAPNMPVVVKIGGTFAKIRVRSELAQSKPYRPLAEVMKQDERIFDHANVKGTLVGFRLPGFVKGSNVPGWHLHFISDDRKIGGHVLGFSAGELKGEYYCTRQLQTVLPRNAMFQKIDHGVDRSAELEQVERKE